MDFVSRGKRVFDLEIESLKLLASNIDMSFTNACQCILRCQGKLVLMGVGKSGHIASKMAATFASTGTPSFFIHPTEACHGDLGMLDEKDVVIAISNSGESEELLAVLPALLDLNVPVIGITNQKDSTLARFATIELLLHVDKEACSLGLAPTSSTTSTLVLGDALAICLLESRSFSADDFARTHPKGSLGKRLLLKASDVMHEKTFLPVVYNDTFVSDVVIEMTEKNLGMTAVLDRETQKPVGLFTDGDLRRLIQNKVDVYRHTIDAFMVEDFCYVSSFTSISEVLVLIESKKINGFLVIDDGILVGAFNVHDLFKIGVL